MFGQMVREHRQRLDITQEELAERTGVGVRTIRDIEAGRVTRPRQMTVRLLAQAFGLSEADRERLHRELAGGLATAEDGGDRPVPAQLPLDVPGFVGRERELAQLDGLMASAGGVTVSVVSGTAGVGKTRLALHWAHRAAKHFPDGQLYVNLRGFDATGPPMSPFQALRGFLDALGVPSHRMPLDPDTQANLYRTLLAGRKMLVLLDNARDADQIRPLLPGAAGSLVVITSRNQLPGLAATEGARLLTLARLSHAEARQLLAQRLGGRVEAEPQATDEIVTACARLSLALAIVAARAARHPGFPLAVLAGQLREARDRLHVLEDDTDPLGDVRSVLSWSYQALDPEAARLFRLLGLVPGYTVTVTAAAALTGDTPQRTRRLLMRLAHSNLLEELSPDCYSFHDLLRLYAAERARIEDGSRDCETALARLFDHYLYSADAAARLLYPQKLRFAPPPPISGATRFEEAGEASAWLDSERANLVATVRHAAEHGPRPLAWRLADALRGYFWLRMHLADWRIIAHAALEAAENGSDIQGRTAAQSSLGDLHYCEAQHHHAIERYTLALALAERTGWLEGQAAIRGSLGAAYRQIGQLRRAADHITQALATLRRLGHVPGQAVNLLNLGVVKWVLGELSEAAECYSQALACYRKVGSQSGEATAFGNLAEVWQALGHHDEAREYLDQSLALAKPIGDRGNAAEGIRLLAAWHRDAGNHAEALELAETATATAHHSGHGRFEAHCLNTTASIHALLGDHERALEAYQRALELARTAADRYPLASALIGLAAAHHHLGRPEPALAHAEQALTVTRHAGYRMLEGQALHCLAAIRLATDAREAAMLARQALAVHLETGFRLGEARARRLLDEAGEIDEYSD